MIKQFFRLIHGNVGTTFAIAAVPLIAVVGAAADYSDAEDQRAITQAALDRASLGARGAMGVLPPEAVAAEAQRLYGDGVERRLSSPSSAVVSLADGNIAISTELRVPTRFLRLVGFDQFAFDLRAEATAANKTYEVALVLDTSGTMAGSKIRALRQAAGDLTRSLFAANRLNPWPDPVRIAVVPFAAAVNVGAQNADAPWIDTKARAPGHLENFGLYTTAAEGNRLALFDALPGVAWAGCVEARPHPYDVEDAAPDAAEPATLFVPMFAPDEPDMNGFDNNYIADVSPACGKNTRPTRAWSADEAQERLCKYKESTPLPLGNGNGTVVGPNLGCTAAPLMPLSNDRSGILETIDALTARGTANLHAGIMWGWRALSPAPPFAEGRPADTASNRKVMIVMTGGHNGYDSYRNFNRSAYGAFGYVSKGHLGTTSADRETVVAKLNERTLEACANAKAEGGVDIYTIAFQVSDPATVDLLRACASSPGKALEADSNSALAATFRDIAIDVATEG
ncbi:MAG: hypothetical protein KDJ86_18505 [Bauldia sp.]|uniref:pilus assembly protein TadG-related protein n=1 Tax=Bauldia sp. TaxID=2575872 RepID=UPI001D87BC02|nr:pilus assembly protein TadG-related protein [Bauldia sp.]MCB1497780.1 hypothetical protein [Bauldia sp.]